MLLVTNYFFRVNERRRVMDSFLEKIYENFFGKMSIFQKF